MAFTKAQILKAEITRDAQNRITRQIFYYIVIIAREGNNAAEGEGKAQVEQLFRVVFRAAEEVDGARRSVQRGACSVQYGNQIREGGAAMDHQGFA